MSCKAWGDSTGTNILDPNDEYPEIQNIPPIIDDGTSRFIYNWFNNPGDANSYPLVVFIDQDMKIVNIFNANISLSSTNFIIEGMLANLSVSSIEKTPIPNEFTINSLFPNPFNPVLHINFDIAWSGVIQLDILDISGSHIEALYSGYLQPGSHELSWNAESMPSGMYLVSLKSGDESLIEKVVLLK